MTSESIERKRNSAEPTWGQWTKTDWRSLIMPTTSKRSFRLKVAKTAIVKRLTSWFESARGFFSLLWKKVNSMHWQRKNVLLSPVSLVFTADGRIRLARSLLPSFNSCSPRTERGWSFPSWISPPPASIWVISIKTPFFTVCSHLWSIHRYKVYWLPLVSNVHPASVWTRCADTCATALHLSPGDPQRIETIVPRRHDTSDFDVSPFCSGWKSFGKFFSICPLMRTIVTWRSSWKRFERSAVRTFDPWRYPWMSL